MSCQECPFRGELVAKAEDAILAKNDLLSTIETLSRRLRLAEGKLKAKHEASPLSEAVAAWLDYWHARTASGRGRPPDMSPGGDRWERALKAMQRKVKHAERHDEQNPVAWALSELKLAVDGILLSPWHTGQNPERRRYLKVENVLKKDEQIDEFIEAGRRAGQEPVEIPLRWLSPAAQERARNVSWVLPLLREALDSAVEWNNELERELQEFREFRSVSLSEVAA